MQTKILLAFHHTHPTHQFTIEVTHLHYSRYFWLTSRMLEYVTYFPWSVPFSQQGMNRLSIYKVSVPYHRGTSHPKILLMYTIRDVFILFLGMFHCLHSPLLWELSRFVGSACREWQWPATARNWPPFCSPSGVQWHWKDASGGRRPCRARFPGASHNCKNTHTHMHTLKPAPPLSSPVPSKLVCHAN